MTEHRIEMTDGCWVSCQVFGSGKALVIQPPGWGCGGEMYAKSLGDLSKERTLIIPDPRGSGQTREPRTEKIHVKQHALDLWRICEQLGYESIDLVGHSNGGWSALLAAIEKPSQVERLILLNAEIEPDAGFDIAQSASIQAMLNDKDRAAGAQAIIDTSERRFDNIKSNAEMWDYFASILPCYAHDPNVLKAAVDDMNLSELHVHALLSSQINDVKHPVRERLSEVKAKTLSITGASDFLGIKWNAQFFVDAIPNCHRFEVSHAGHYPWIEQPEITLAAIRAHLNDMPAAWS